MNYASILMVASSQAQLLCMCKRRRAGRDTAILDYLATVPSDISPEEDSWTQKEMKLLGFDIGCEISPAMSNFKPEFIVVMLRFAQGFQ
ncbi:uncharacterized protein HD556DRAFT_1439214 [Suillus plorans]|uniref:Uncharacterized protein n=1 Tax=Suillus plorans TaxID=116603 RepID=A0A9P7DQ54_9AGAM|nr:uncharacterized protein HD556DRAFT_1439214 [Suillus plorans]KAG1800358.1 hypothetical protein HD556DRAFT_1439214 [Suillus plorans]